MGSSHLWENTRKDHGPGTTDLDQKRRGPRPCRTSLPISLVTQKTSQARRGERGESTNVPDSLADWSLDSKGNERIFAPVGGLSHCLILFVGFQLSKLVQDFATIYSSRVCNTVSQVGIKLNKPGLWWIPSGKNGLTENSPTVSLLSHSMWGPLITSWFINPSTVTVVNSL